MSVTPTTTIRIPRGLHQLIVEQAGRRDLTMVGLIERALRQMLDDEFWHQANEAVQSPGAADMIQADLAQWDCTVSDGLSDEDWSWLRPA